MHESNRILVASYFFRLHICNDYDRNSTFCACLKEWKPAQIYHGNEVVHV